MNLGRFWVAGVMGCLVFALGAAGGANADTIIGPVFPGPTGATFSGAGIAAGQTGGGTATISNIDLSSVGQLWWGPITVQLGATGYSISTLTLSSGPISGNTETWTGTVNLPNLTNFGLSNVQVLGRFTATILSGAPGGWIDATSLGITGPNNALAVAEITSSTFSVAESFEVSNNGGATWVPFLNFYNTLNTDNFQSRMSVSGGLYYTAPVPGPIVGAGLPGLIAAGGWLIALARRRRKGRVPA